MINLPPPTPPAPVPAAPASLPSFALPLEIQETSQQLAAVLASMKQQAVLAVSRLQYDTTKQLLTLTTPQGTASLQVPNPPPAITLPNGTALSLAEVLPQLATAPPASLKNVYVQFDKPLDKALAAGTLPPVRLLFNLAEFISGTKTTAPLQPVAPSVQPFNAGNLIRTTLTPLPESAVQALGLLQQSSSATLTGTDNAANAGGQNTLLKLWQSAQQGLSRWLPTKDIPSLTAPATPTISSGTLNSTQPVMVVPAGTDESESAVVLGATPKGDAIVRTASGQLFSLNNVRAQNIGANIFLKTVAPLPGPSGAMPLPTEPLHHLLQEVTQLLQTVDATLATRFSQQLQANPGQNLGGALLLIFSVLKGGALTGKTYDRSSINLDEALAKALPDGTKARLLQALQEEPASLTRMVSDAVGMEWRGHQIPTPNLPGFTGPVWFYVQQQRADDYQGQQAAANNALHPTRFVIDLDFSRLGHTQLEGIAAPQKLDLKINTGQALPASMQDELRALYSNTLSGYGLQGMLSFSTDAPVDLENTPANIQMLS